MTLTRRYAAVIYPAWNNSSNFFRGGRRRAATGRPPGTTAVDRGADLLVRVLESEQPVALAELASASGIPKSTASRLVSALERRGLIQQDGERGRLRPGPAILRVAERSMLERSVVELARPSLDALAQASGETINLAVPARHGVEHVAQVDSRHFLGAGQWLGRSVDYHCTRRRQGVPGFWPRDDAGPTAGRDTPETITDPARLRAELETVRREELRHRDRRARARARRRSRPRSAAPAAR